MSKSCGSCESPSLPWLLSLVLYLALTGSAGFLAAEAQEDAAQESGSQQSGSQRSGAPGGEYRVIEPPLEDPARTTPPAPADGRVLISSPQILSASPFGWHDTDGVPGPEFTTPQGNNTHTWEDSDGDDMEPDPATEPDCGASLICDFSLDLSQEPDAYRPASTTNLFFWINWIHDIQYQYGFDEVAGNFQVNNYGNGGEPGDDVRALAQSGIGNCNANMRTLPDGQRPLLRMYTCNRDTPTRAGDLDNGIIAHEYGHGISNRQVGGPNNVSCLNNTQQPGEGWSDWFALAYTARPSDTGPQARGIGTWLFGQGPDDPGIRVLPYSTDPEVNDWTLSSMAGMSVPHGVGTIWAQGIWEVYWELVEEHGFDPDLSNALGSAGNQRAMLYVNEGLKNTACSPTLLDSRDGVLQAVLDNHGGEDLCRVWRAFANYGMGSDATAGGPGTQVGFDGFALPQECIPEFSLEIPELHAGICAPETATYELNFASDTATGAIDLDLMFAPPGTTPSFSIDPVTAPGTSILSLADTDAAAPGSYLFELEAVNESGEIELDLTLDVSFFTPEATILSQPIDGEVGVILDPAFVWSPTVQSLSYYLEVATDISFSNIVYTTTVSDPEHVFEGYLEPSTRYFWRVTASNDCGSSDLSAIHRFTTANMQCSAPHIFIPDVSPSGATDTMEFSQTGTIDDLDVIVRASHILVGDLIFRLTHVPTGTEVTLIDQPGVPETTFGCLGDDIDARLDDSASSPVEEECTGEQPSIAGSLSPNEPLAAFQGEDLSGTWSMIAVDNKIFRTGFFEEWCLISTVPATNTLFQDGFESGDTSAWSLTFPANP